MGATPSTRKVNNALATSPLVLLPGDYAMEESRAASSSLAGEALLDGTCVRGTGVLNSIPSTVRRCEICAPAGPGMRNPESSQWEPAGHWHFQALMPRRLAQESLSFLPGDTVDFTCVRLNGETYFQEIKIRKRGPCHKDMEVNGVPQDFSFSFARYMLNCSVSSSWGCARWCDGKVVDSSVFTQLFSGMAVHWRGVVKERPVCASVTGRVEVIVDVVEEGTVVAKDREPIQLVFRGGNSSVGERLRVGNAITFEATLASQGGAAAPWSTMTAVSSLPSGTSATLHRLNVFRVLEVSTPVRTTRAAASLGISTAAVRDVASHLPSGEALALGQTQARFRVDGA